jgi:hypothetical protein
VQFGIAAALNLLLRLPAVGDNAAMNGSDEIELSRDRPSARAFWSAVLSFASASRATAVFYRPAQGEDCLGWEVDSATYTMVPPPAELRPWLLKEGRRLAGLSWVQSAKRVAKSLLRLRSPPGKIYIKLGGTVTEWTPYTIVGGLRFESTPITGL